MYNVKFYSCIGSSLPSYVLLRFVRGHIGKI